MRVAEVAKLFAGSVAIYLVVAACGSAYSEQHNPNPPEMSSGGPAASTSMMNPVPNALAEGDKSGSRLRLRFWQGSDMSRQFIDFYDSQLMTNCDVTNGITTSDGKVRCLPAIAGEIYYSDGQCMTPAIYAVLKTDPQPQVVAVETRPSNGPSYRDHFTLKGLINPPSSLFYGSKDGNTGAGQTGCAAATAPAGQNYYEVGPPLPPSTFVEMTIAIE